jgi:thioredoxin reductase
VVEDSAIGGQAGTSSRIENYMGFPTGISGADLTFRGQVQAMKFGTCFAMPRRVEGLSRRDGGFCVHARRRRGTVRPLGVSRNRGPVSPPAARPA